MKSIYCFDDAIGVDADFMFSFSCNARTAKKIIDTHGLQLDTAATSSAFGLQHDFEWWDKRKIATLKLYRWHKNNRHFKHFWYDEAEGKACYFEFTL